jgi:hypothetical protein
VEPRASRDFERGTSERRPRRSIILSRHSRRDETKGARRAPGHVLNSGFISLRESRYLRGSLLAPTACVDLHCHIGSELIDTILGAQMDPLTDRQWARVSHLFDTSAKAGRPAADPRAALNAILWVVVQGKRWHHLPPGHPASQTCYNKWLTWKKDGTWQKIVDELGSELVLPPA